MLEKNRYLSVDVDNMWVENTAKCDPPNNRVTERNSKRVAYGLLTLLLLGFWTLCSAVNAHCRKPSLFPFYAKKMEKWGSMFY